MRSRVQREEARIWEWKAVLLVINSADSEFKHSWGLQPSSYFKNLVPQQGECLLGLQVVELA